MKVARALALVVALQPAGTSATSPGATPVATKGSSDGVAVERLQVVEVLGATGDAYEAAEVDGVTWVATSGGLVLTRDGRVTRVLDVTAGLPGNRLRSISVLPEGVWVGGVDGAALVARDLHVVRTVPLHRVRRVVRYRDALLFATYGGGVVRERDGALAALASVGARTAVTDLLVRPDGLYVSTAGKGVMRVDAEGRVDRRWRKSDGLADDVVWDLEPSDARVLLATASGISALSGHGVDVDAPEARATRSLPVTDVRALAQGNGELVVATFGGGLQRIAHGMVQPMQGPSFVRSVIHGSAGWIATHEAMFAGGLPSADVSALAVAGDGLYIGTFDHGLAVRDARGEVRTVADVDPRINDLATAGDFVFAATDGGLFAGRDGSLSRVTVGGAPPREHVQALWVDAPSASVWAAGSHGVSRLQAGAWKRWPTSEALDAVATDARGQVWLGSQHGLLRLDPATGDLERHDVASGDVPVDWITATVPWASGMAVGTYNGGIALVGAAYQIVRETDGLPSGWVNPHAMRTVGGELWIGALDAGLVVGHPGAWRRLGVDAHLPSADVTAIAPTGDGSVWVATRGGVARITSG